MRSSGGRSRYKHTTTDIVFHNLEYVVAFTFYAVNNYQFSIMSYLIVDESKPSEEEKLEFKKKISRSGFLTSKNFSQDCYLNKVPFCCHSEFRRMHGKARQGKFIHIAHFIHNGNSKCFTWKKLK